jgi:outer membrane receptor protein involved in Fe transport
MMDLRTSAISAVVICGIFSQTYAQGSEAGTADEVVEEIVVTGSRLPRRDFTAPSPIATIDAEALAASGQATLEESLNRMPQMAPDFSRTTNNGSDGTSKLNLRGLGADRTLVLLNGRRLAPSGTGSAVDVNNQPQVLMERVEIITGGATTVYGADAVAGVVNFITRSDFEGFAVDTSAYMSEQGDSNIYDINVTWGHDFANGRGNITLYGGYYDREETFGSERDFADETIIDWWDGTFAAGGSSIIPAGIVQQPRYDFGSGSPSRIMFDSNGGPLPYDGDTDYYNYAPINYIQTPLQRMTAGLFLNYDLNDSVELYSEMSYAYNDATSNLAPVPAIGFFAVNPDNPFFSPEMQQIAADEFFPLGDGTVGMVFGRRMVDLGPRTIVANNEYTRLVLGFRGAINEVWDFDAWYTWTEGKEDEFFLNDASNARMQQGLLVDPVTGECFDPSGGCVALNLFGEGNLSPEGLAFMRYEPFKNVTSRTQNVLSAFVRGAPFDSWAGPINMAFGVEYRDDSGDFQADEVLFSDDTLGYRADASVNGEESVYEFYTEALIPLAEGAAWAEYLGLEVGGRLSQYDHAGKVETWKIGGEWQLPVPIKFRTMVQRSVRAPNLGEAFTEQGTEQGTFSGNNFDNDPCSAGNDPVGSGFTEQCIATGLPAGEVGVWTSTQGFPTDYVFGGNPEVRPEVADTFTAGFVFDIDWFLGTQISVDYFNLEVEDTIGDLDAQIACFDTANTQQEFCGNIERDQLSYNVNRVYEPVINRGLFTVKGVDTQVDLEADLPGGAGLSVGMIWTHTLESSFQEASFGTQFECAGYFGWPCAFERWTVTYPENRVNVNIAYFLGDFTARLAWRWIEGTSNGIIPYKDELGFGWADPALTETPSESYIDLSFAYRFSDNISARFAIANVADTAPVFMADYAMHSNTDPSVYDVFGRAYTLGFTLEF